MSLRRGPRRRRDSHQEMIPEPGADRGQPRVPGPVRLRGRRAQPHPYRHRPYLVAGCRTVEEVARHAGLAPATRCTGRIDRVAPGDIQVPAATIPRASYRAQTTAPPALMGPGRCRRCVRSPVESSGRRPSSAGSCRASAAISRRSRVSETPAAPGQGCGSRGRPWCVRRPTSRRRTPTREAAQRDRTGCTGRPRTSSRSWAWLTPGSSGAATSRQRLRGCPPPPGAS